ncbi:Non-histone chromosomal protein 6 [Microbotryomycetes sp. JL221]|nr:Non-histone chromosomal protein 6 [Microbotryomycetes sp. JL221]
MAKEAKPRTTKAASGSKGRAGKKDPNAPKRPLSAYMHFSQQNREKIKSENPEASFGELGKLLGGKWKEMSDSEKKPYTDMADKDKARYEKEKEGYEPAE